MPKFNFKPILPVSILSILVTGLGCADGPLFELKKVNPYYRKQWAKDRELGPTYEDRLAEARLVKRQLPSMSAEEKSTWAKNLEKLLANDPSPDMRREAVLALGSVDTVESLKNLQKASQDDSEKVRLAVCEALGKRTDQESLQLLGKLAQSDESSSVKVAAIKAMSNYKGEEVRSLLAKSIQDRSPAIQFQTTESLAKVTGEKLGGDVALWKRYLAGEPIEKPQVTMAEQIGAMIGIDR